MLTHHRPPIIAILILCSFLLSACAAGNGGREESPMPERSKASESPLASPVPTGTPTSPPATVITEPPLAPETTPQADIIFVSDEFDAVVYVLPRAWGQYITSPWQEDDRVIGSTITASSDLGAYLNWGAPGLTISVSRRLTKGYIEMMDEFRDVFAEPCEEHQLRWEYENEFQRGIRQRFWHCGGEDGPTLDLLALVSKEDPQAYIAMVIIVWFIPREIQLNEDAILSFFVIPESLP